MFRPIFSRNLNIKNISANKSIIISANNLHDKQFFKALTYSNNNNWHKAISDAEKLVGYSTSFLSLRHLISDELSNVMSSMKRIVGTNHPLLTTAQQMFIDGNKTQQTRGLLVLLISKAAGHLQNMDNTNSLEEVLVSGISAKQRSLAEVTEMIQSAKRIHKSVMDLNHPQDNESLSISTMPQNKIEDMHFANKMAILGGDYLLANASTGLAALENTKIVELMSEAICNMMEAEFTEFQNSSSISIYGDHLFPNINFNSQQESVTDSKLSNILDYSRRKSGFTLYKSNTTNEKFNKKIFNIKNWEEQTYLSSGSLLAHSCKSALMLANHKSDMLNASFDFGKIIAMAQQVNEEILLFKDHTKLKMNNENLLTSLPAILYFKQDFKDVEQNDKTANKLLKEISENRFILEESKNKCKDYCNRAIDCLNIFKASDAKDILKKIVNALTII